MIWIDKQPTNIWRLQYRYLPEMKSDYWERPSYPSWKDYCPKPKVMSGYREVEFSPLLREASFWNKWRPSQRSITGQNAGNRNCEMVTSSLYIYKATPTLKAQDKSGKNGWREYGKSVIETELWRTCPSCSRHVLGREGSRGLGTGDTLWGGGECGLGTVDALQGECRAGYWEWLMV